MLKCGTMILPTRNCPSCVTWIGDGVTVGAWGERPFPLPFPFDVGVAVVVGGDEVDAVADSGVDLAGLEGGAGVGVASG